MKTRNKLKVSLTLTILLVSFMCSFLGFPIFPVRATTETRYMANNVWVTGTYNLSKTNTASVVTTNVLTSVEYEYQYCYFGIKVYVGMANGSLILVSGANPVAVATYTLASATQNFQVSATWAHSTVTQTGINVTIYAYADQNNPPTTLCYKFSTENMTEFATITDDAWTVYYAGKETWYSATETSIISFKFGDATYISKVTGFAVEEASITNPTYTDVASSPTYPFGGNTLSFSTNWTAGEGSLDKYILSTNNTGSWTNQTAVAFSGGTWSNTTLTANATGDIQLGWRIYANNTSGGANVTDIQTLYIWKPIPPPSDHILGQSAGFTWGGGIYYAGAHHVIYVAYQNSSVSPWEYYVAGYDVNETAWYVVNTGLSSSATDVHYNPSISVLPDGRLILLVGYYTPLKFSVSILNANTETNTSVLLSSWSSLADAPSSTIYSYPNPCHFSDRVVVFGREGASYGGNISEIVWKADTNITTYVTSFDSTYTQWNTAYVYPYLDEDGRGIYFTSPYDTEHYSEGWFNWNTSTYVQSNDVLTGATLKIYANLSSTPATPLRANCTVTLRVNGTIYNYTMATAGWKLYEFDVSSCITSGYDLHNATLLFTDVGTLAVRNYNVTYAKLCYNYTGFGDESIIFLPPAGFESSYWHFSYNSSGFIMGAGYAFSYVTSYSKNIYGMYSSDYGVTWRRMNETTPQTLPYNLTGALLYTTNQYSRCAAPTWDENNKIVISYHMYESVYSQLDYQFKVGICSFNSTLGSATGVWSIANATDVYENELTGYTDIGAPLMLDSWYNRPTIWLAPDNLIKYVRLPNSTSQFLAVVNDTTEYGITHLTVPIYESQGYYSVFSQEAYTNSFGNRTGGTNKQTLDDHLIIGTKFTPTRNCTLDWGMIWAEMNWTVDADWQMGIYFASNMSILSNSTKVTLTSGAGGTGWSIRSSFPLSSGATLYENVEYWLCARYGQNGTTSIFYNTDSTNTNYTLYKTNFPFTTSQFPSVLAPTGYYNWTLTMFATPSFLRVRGLGVMEFSDIGTNTTIAGAVCQFRTYVKNDNGLSYSYFRSNNTGTWDNTTYSMSLTGTAIYVYFNVTLNSTAQKVLWEIWVNDSNNNWGHTPTQTLTLSINMAVVLSDVALGFMQNYMWKALMFQPLTAINFHAESVFGKAIGFLATGIVNLISSLGNALSTVYQLLASIVPNSNTFFWKATSFQPANTFNAYASLEVGKGLEFLSSETMNGFSTLLKGMSLTYESAGTIKLSSVRYFWKALPFQLGGSINLFGYTSIYKALGFQATDMIRTFESTSMLKGMGFLSLGLVRVFAFGSMSKEVGFQVLEVQRADNIFPFATTYFWKAIGFQPSNTINVYDSLGIGKGLGFLTSGSINVFSSHLKGMSLAFQSGETIRLWDSGVMLKALGFQTSVTTRLFDSSTMLKGLGYLATNTVNIFDSSSMLKALSFQTTNTIIPSSTGYFWKAIGLQPTATIKAYDSSVMQKAIGFLSVGTINVYSAILRGIELGFAPSGILYPFAYGSSGKETASILVDRFELTKLFGSLYFNMEKGFSSYDVMLPSANLIEHKAFQFWLDGLVKWFSDVSLSFGKIFNTFETVNPFASLSMGKELGFTTYNMLYVFDTLAMSKSIHITLFELSELLQPFATSLTSFQSAIPPSAFWKILAMFCIVMLMTTGVFLVEKQRKSKQQQSLES